ncbi:MAG: amidohydrolase family protein [Planctomycetota bacterium]
MRRHDIRASRSPLRRLRPVLLLPLAFGVALTLATEDPGGPIAYSGATIIPVDGPPIPNGVMVVNDGRITALGPAETTLLPAGGTVVDLSGRTLIPGLICTHSHLGRGGGGDSAGPIQPEADIFEAVNIRNAGFRRAVAGGLTTINVMPGSGHLISGQTTYLKLRDGNTIDDLVLRDADGLRLGGLKMANGTNSLRGAPFPGTRAKSAALVRAKYLAAREYAEKIARAAGDPEKLPSRDLSLEPLVEAMAGKRVVHHHTHRHDDILTVLRLANEFGFRVVLHHVSEAWKVADEIAAAGAACSLILIDSPGGKLEARDIDYRNGAILESRGVPVAFHTDDWITDSRLFLRMAALAVRAGMTREGALRALTLSGAEMLDLEARTGSLTVGKDADFVVLDGDPFSVYTKVLATYVEGRKVFDRSVPEDLLFAEGGRGAGDDQTFQGCCMGRQGAR